MRRHQMHSKTSRWPGPVVGRAPQALVWKPPHTLCGRRPSANLTGSFNVRPRLPLWWLAFGLIVPFGAGCTSCGRSCLPSDCAQSPEQTPMLLPFITELSVADVGAHCSATRDRSLAVTSGENSLRKSYTGLGSPQSPPLASSPLC